MTNRNDHFFDGVAKSVTSLGAVIVALCLIITGMVAFSHTLFGEVFPDTMSAWEKSLATWVMASGWELTVLLTTVNKTHISKVIPPTLAIASGIIVLFFIGAFDTSLSPLEMTQRWFVGILAAAINYIYTELFNAKWQERLASLKEGATLDELKSELINLRSKLIKRNVENENLLLALNENSEKWIRLNNEMTGLLTFKNEIELQLTCPYCGTIKETFGQLHIHKGYCDKNPKRRKGKRERAQKKLANNQENQ